eukprot:TRINITY_DN8459_c0_g1_i5.p1 TRINITY_DN8459_c0_g1~~TRINITY_DN8459_c0_g1_i5.p1  ORF type:complete len:155 (-),score=24.00 TRINITY_DN8459_c0_g1_i5:47-511(-)
MAMGFWKGGAMAFHLMSGGQYKRGGLVPLLPALKFQKQASSSGEEIEKAYSDTDLNTLVGSSENYFVKEMQPVDSLLHELRSYQKQVLFWMSKMEKEKQMKEAMKSIHPYWDAYKISARFTSSLLLTTSLLPLIVAIGLLQQQLLHLKCCYRRI